MRSLKELHLSHNKLTSIQYFDVIFPNLDFLDISQNEVADNLKLFASIIFKMKNLYILKLSGNPLTEIEKYVIGIRENV